MASLLDGHPNVLNTPDCVLLHFYKFWEAYGHLPARELIPLFMEYYAVLFDGRAESRCFGHRPKHGEYLGFTRLGANQDECLQVDREAFKRRITEIIGEAYPISRRLFFQALHVAYNEAIGRKVKDAVIVFGLHVANPVAVQSLIDDFPETLFLQMVRRPISGLGSHFRHHYVYGDYNSQTGFGALRLVAYSGVVVPPECRSRWRAVRLEDLHQRPRETLQKVCDYLDLPWDDSLLNSTVCDKQWWNENNSPRVKGFSDDIISQRFESFLTDFDRFRLNVLLAPKCVAWGYPVHPWYRTIVAKLVVLPLLFIPFKMELISLSSIRKSYKEDARSFLTRLRRAIYNAGRAVYLGRRLLFGIWLDTFRKERHEVSLL